MIIGKLTIASERMQPNFLECETCNEWFHPACVQIFGDEEEIKKINFSCLDCRKKNEAGSTEREENLGKRDPNHGGDEQ